MDARSAKILVAGPRDAGKTSFVRSSGGAASPAGPIDHVRVRVDGLGLDLYAAPADGRHAAALARMAAACDAMLLVVDAGRPDSFRRAAEIAAVASRPGLPVVLAANKQDDPAARRPDEVARLVGLPAAARVVGCVATDPSRCVDALRAVRAALAEP